MLKEKKLIEDQNIAKDIILLKSQAERCKEILQRFSKNPLKLKDNFLEKVKISDLIKINFDKFNNNKNLILKINPSDYEPEILYRDEIMYALGNIVQNAIFYSKEKITAEVLYLKTSIQIVITDDGNGYSKDIIDKLGEPYVSKNKQGMGLGIFIAKNLIENMGGTIQFYNSKQNYAVVEIKFDNSILSI